MKKMLSMHPGGWLRGRGGLASIPPSGGSAMISRRSALLGAVSGAAVAGLGINTAKAEPVSLKVSHYLPPNHTFQKELVQWGEALAQQSQGQLTLNIFPASQLGPVNRQFDLVRNGVVDIAVGLHGATPGR